MSLLAAGTTVGFESKPWKMDDGKSGVTHTLTISTGDSTHQVKVPLDVVELLGTDLDKLRQFGRPLVCRLVPAARDSDYGAAKLELKVKDVRFCRLADLAQFGYEVEVYQEDEEPSSNGAHLASVD